MAWSKCPVNCMVNERFGVLDGINQRHAERKPGRNSGRENANLYRAVMDPRSGLLVSTLDARHPERNRRRLLIRGRVLP